MKKIKQFIFSPIFIFGILSFIIMIFLIVKTNLTVPDYYTNKSLAISLVNIPNSENSIRQLHNPSYKIFNPIFHLLGWFVAIFAICCCFKIKNFKDFLKLCNINNETFISLWVNISFLFFASAHYSATIINLEQFVYPSNADSFSIPMGEMMIFWLLIAAFYYPFINLLYKILYNGKVNKKILMPFFILVAVFIIFSNLDVANIRFSYNNIILNFCTIVWIFLTISTIKFQKTKEIKANETILNNKMGKISNSFNWGAFLFTFIWGAVTKVWKAFLWIPLFIISFFLPSPLEMLPLAFAIWLGFNANRIIIENNRCKDIEV